MDQENLVPNGAPNFGQEKKEQEFIEKFQASDTLDAPLSTTSTQGWREN